MSGAITVDARGLSCPEPVMRAKAALAGAGESEVEVLVDATAARDNVSRFARSQGREVSVADFEDGWKVAIGKRQGKQANG
ncbi:MAG: sulfurtransferase TusA family protein [Synergistaceae bacterium]|jgi:TusA-related sulfurtransferase|nr:sulfurtransferase TusA family protein [Synergistaceae bacterium]